jgi:hypothetical protein
LTYCFDNHGNHPAREESAPEIPSLRDAEMILPFSPLFRGDETMWQSKI